MGGLLGFWAFGLLGIARFKHFRPVADFRSRRPRFHARAIKKLSMILSRVSGAHSSLSNLKFTGSVSTTSTLGWNAWLGPAKLRFGTAITAKIADARRGHCTAGRFEWVVNIGIVNSSACRDPSNETTA